MNKHKRLHLGCGKKHIPGFTHIDIQPNDHIDYVSIVSKLDMIENETIELIYACHLLEHFGRHECSGILEEWHKKLRKNGILRLAVPNFEACIDYYMQSNDPNKINKILGLVCGGQKNEYDFHKMIYDKELLVSMLSKIGFREIYEWDWRQTEHSEIDDYSQSYLPHMDKKNGKLMSLNIEAIK